MADVENPEVVTVEDLKRENQRLQGQVKSSKEQVRRLEAKKATRKSKGGMLFVGFTGLTAGLGLASFITAKVSQELAKSSKSALNRANSFERAAKGTCGNEITQVEKCLNTGRYTVDKQKVGALLERDRDNCKELVWPTFNELPHACTVERPAEKKPERNSTADGKLSTAVRCGGYLKDEGSRAHRAIFEKQLSESNDLRAKAEELGNASRHLGKVSDVTNKLTIGAGVAGAGVGVGASL